MLVHAGRRTATPGVFCMGACKGNILGGGIQISPFEKFLLDSMEDFNNHKNVAISGHNRCMSLERIRISHHNF